MKYKYMLIALAILLPASAFGVTFVQKTSVDTEDFKKVEGSTKVEVKMDSDNKGTSTKEKNNDTSTENKDNENATTTNSGKGELTSEEHRSTVATFVKSILGVADREGGIGAEVRLVAQSQNDSASTTIKAVDEVESRGSFKTFLFGSDYKNLGIIRSEIATTSKNIDKLKGLLAKTIWNADKAEITAQIKTLEDQQVKMDAYITAHESLFSLFGWFAKLFNK